MSINLKITKNVSRVLAKLNHDFKNIHLFSSKKISSQEFDFKKNLNHKISDKFIIKISNYAKYLRDNKPKANNDLWGVISKIVNYKEFLNTVCDAKENKEKFIELILNCGKENLTYGFGTNRRTYQELFKKKIFREKEKYYFLDYLLSLSEYYKLTKVHNPEQGGWIIENENFNHLIKEIFKKKNILPFKTANYYYGYKFEKNFLFLKDLKGLYAAERLSETYKNNNLSEIIEIGGGLGYTCHYVKQLFDCRYTMYDLPHTSLLAAIYLMISQGVDNVNLENEKPNKKNKIFIKPFWKIFDNKSKSKILWFNEDSFLEIDFQLSKKYIKKIFKSKNSFLFSVNHEARTGYKNSNKAHHTVYDLLPKHKRIYRSRDFLRPGYIEELIEV